MRCQRKTENRVAWRTILKNTDHPVYLGVIVDRILKFKERCKKIKMKIQTRNNLLGKLVGSEWEAGSNYSTDD